MSRNPLQNTSAMRRADRYLKIADAYGIPASYEPWSPDTDPTVTGAWFKATADDGHTLTVVITDIPNNHNTAYAWTTSPDKPGETGDIKPSGFGEWWNTHRGETR